MHIDSTVQRGLKVDGGQIITVRTVVIQDGSVNLQLSERFDERDKENLGKADDETRALIHGVGRQTMHHIIR